MCNRCCNRRQPARLASKCMLITTTCICRSWDRSNLLPAQLPNWSVLTKAGLVMQRAQFEMAKPPEKGAAARQADDELTAIEDPARFQGEPDFWEGEGWEVRGEAAGHPFGSVAGRSDAARLH